ncbi:hypothetical protein PGT21_014773 [Puccinia graminis f. sp. tritici]|uniref:NAD(P)-binding protein n=1 Tax=Puccinia graminis f. sp. tritici TaxID=56615 RepID=A0A5B0MHZ9_PUCGR|nr:hypothetical protein PGT21_014773 [Puccinia graminis f. sp. tritici]KAA1075684.1 hypothetical protein PGTUg99_034683 [Puccinia graminis f. sp. tritici]
MVFGFFESHWSFDQIPDLTGKVAIVTGGNSGLGYITCLELARKNARVYMASRNKTKAEEAIQKIKQELTTKPNNDNKKKSASSSSGEDSKSSDQIKEPFIEFLEFDLTKISAGKKTAEAFLSKEDRLDMLINNAGIMATPYELSEDGIELQACNGTGHFGLTIPLLPILKKTDAAGSQVRIVNLSSIAHRTAASKPDFSSLEALNRKYSSTWIRYGNSKLSNILFNSELQRRLEGTNIHCLAVHPGVVDTDLFRGLGESFPLLKPFLGVKSLFRGTVLISPEQGAITQLYAATSPEVVEKNLKGKYLVPYAKLETPNQLAQDPDHTLALQFWSLCETLYQSKI